MTNQSDWIEDYVSIETEVSIADGSTVTAKGRGNVSLDAVVNGKVRPVILYDVLFVPSFKYSLLSIPASTSRGNQVVFNGNQVHVKKGEHVVANGSRVGRDLYRLNVKDNFKACLAASPPVSLKTWHQRLGHVNMGYIQEMVKKGSVLGLKVKEGENKINELCKGCILAKQTRASHSLTERKRKDKPGHLIHGDLCGPLKVKSCSGYKYFFLLKDDHSDYRVVYFLREKSEVKERMKDFIILVNHDLEDGVKFSLRTDNGREFTDKQFRNLLQEKGWRHEFSTPFTPEWSGRT